LINVSGLDSGVAVPVSVSGGEYALNGATTYTSAINWAVNGDTINVRHTSATSENFTTNTRLSLGGVMALNDITHVGTGETVMDTYSTTTEAASGGGGGTMSWLVLLGLCVLAPWRLNRHRQAARATT